MPPEAAVIEAAAAAEPAPIEFVTLGDFLKADFPPAESLCGHVRKGTNLLPRYGWVIPYGPAGSTKTTMLVDLLFHGASGRDWIGYPMEREIRFVVIVNEGVPGALKDKLQEKFDLWQDENVADRLAIYKSPWGAFSFRNERMVRNLQDFARDFEADYIAADPLHTLGTSGTGTPEETEEFKHLLRAFGLWDWIGFITPHHVNKVGQISGDWERQPDTVISLEKKKGAKATKFTIKKARPADPDEIDTPVILEWDTETLGYRRTTIDTRQKTSDEDLLTGIYATLDSNERRRFTMTEVRADVHGNDKRIGELVKGEIEAGRVHNSSTAKDTYLLQRATASARPLWADPADNHK